MARLVALYGWTHRGSDHQRLEFLVDVEVSLPPGATILEVFTALRRAAYAEASRIGPRLSAELGRLQDGGEVREGDHGVHG